MLILVFVGYHHWNLAPSANETYRALSGTELLRPEQDSSRGDKKGHHADSSHGNDAVASACRACWWSTVAARFSRQAGPGNPGRAGIFALPAVRRCPVPGLPVQPLSA